MHLCLASFLEVFAQAGRFRATARRSCTSKNKDGVCFALTFVKKLSSARIGGGSAAKSAIALRLGSPFSDRHCQDWKVLQEEAKELGEDEGEDNESSLSSSSVSMPPSNAVDAALQKIIAEVQQDSWLCLVM